MLLKSSSALGYLANPAFSLKPTGSDNSKNERIRTMERRLKNYLLYCYPMWKKKAKENWMHASDYERKGKKITLVLYSLATVVLKLKFNKCTNGDNSHFPPLCFTALRFLTILSERA